MLYDVDGCCRLFYSFALSHHVSTVIEMDWTMTFFGLALIFHTQYFLVEQQ